MLRRAERSDPASLRLSCRQSMAERYLTAVKLSGKVIGYTRSLLTRITKRRVAEDEEECRKECGWSLKAEASCWFQSYVYLCVRCREDVLTSRERAAFQIHYVHWGRERERERERKISITVRLDMSGTKIELLAAAGYNTYTTPTNDVVPVRSMLGRLSIERPLLLCPHGHHHSVDLDRPTA